MKKSYTGLFLVEETGQTRRYIAQFDFEEKNRETHLRFVSSTLDGLVEEMHDELKQATQQLSKGQKAIIVAKGIEGKISICNPAGGYSVIRPMNYLETGCLLSELKRIGVKTRKR